MVHIQTIMVSTRGQGREGIEIFGNSKVWDGAMLGVRVRTLWLLLVARREVGNGDEVRVRVSVSREKIGLVMLEGK